MVLLLAGCAAAPVIPTEVQIPVVVSCIDRPIERPELATDAGIRALNDYHLPLQLWLDRRVRQLYEQRLEAMIEACRTAQPPP